ncbi:MAG: tryptophan synthase alpha chain [Cellvibrionaceae bacterium]|jgi:tryptophan synthase alpha chain
MTALKASRRKAFVAYIVSGDPRPDVTLPTMHALVEEGVDVIELGVPFSDPMAEGQVIQLGHERALTHNFSLTNTLELVRSFRLSNTTTPVVLMGYANPIERMGYDRFAYRAAEAGVDGVLTVDLPPEESEAFSKVLRTLGLENIFLLAPTTTPSRIRHIISMAGGFIYYVSLKGVTGAGNLDTESVRQKIMEIRQLTDLPLCVGFGIKDGQSAKSVAQYADGAVVGSIFVDKMGASLKADDLTIVNGVRKLARDIRSGLDQC